MNIRTRMCISLDGYITRADGYPVQLADPSFKPGQSHRFPEFQESCEAVLMGRTTFEPALGSDRWPWPDLDAFVLGSHRPDGTPDDVVVESAPATLLERIRSANKGGDVHLVGGPSTIETFRKLGALKACIEHVRKAAEAGGGRVLDSGSERLMVLLSAPDAAADTAAAMHTSMDSFPQYTDVKLTLESEDALPEGAVDLVYDCR